MKGGYVYIMTNGASGTLYIGVTANLGARVAQHRSGSGSDFCRRYGLVRLVYIERHDRIDDAIAREKALKAWKRVEARSHRPSQSGLGRPLLDGQRLRQQTWMPAFSLWLKVILSACLSRQSKGWHDAGEGARGGLPFSLSGHMLGVGRACWRGRGS